MAGRGVGGVEQLDRVAQRGAHAGGAEPGAQLHHAAGVPRRDDLRDGGAQPLELGSEHRPRHRRLHQREQPRAAAALLGVGDRQQPQHGDGAEDGEWRLGNALGVQQVARRIVGDAPALVARVAAETIGAPLAWIGHSYGSVIGLCWLARQPTPPPEVTAVVALGTPGPGGMSFTRRVLALGTIMLARVLGQLPARALRLGPEDEAAHVIGDWMGWNVRGRWLGRDGFDYFAALRRLHTPLLAVAGEGDHLMAPPFACRQVFEQVGATRKQFVVAGPRLNHSGLLIDPKARDRCWPAVADWLDATLRPA